MNKNYACGQNYNNTAQEHIFTFKSTVQYHVLLTYAFSLARSIGHRLRNATVFCLWPSSPFLSRCTPSLLYLFLCLSARCFVAYLFFSSLGGSMWWLDGWLILMVSLVYVLSTSIFSSLFHFLWVVAWLFSRVWCSVPCLSTSSVVFCAGICWWRSVFSFVSSVWFAMSPLRRAKLPSHLS